MLRGLINTVPIWLLLIVAIGAIIALTLGLVWLIRRLVPAVREGFDAEVSSQLLGVVAALFGLLLAFIVVIAYQNFGDSQSNVSSEADALAAEGDEQSLRRALELDPRHTPAAVELGRILLERGEAQEAEEVLANVAGDFIGEGLAARAKLVTSGAVDDLSDLREAFDALSAGDHERALERLESALSVAQDDTRDLIRRVMVGLFAELGADHPLSREYRRKLAAALY